VASSAELANTQRASSPSFLANHFNTPMTGQYRVLSKYRLIARLGSGGMAEVFLAVTGSPRGFNKLQVLKVLRTDLPEQERADFVRMFRDEGRLAARLNHPNIVQSHEVGSEEGHEFIAMEYLEGQPLSNVQGRAWALGEEAFPLELQLHIFCLVLEGLDYAHTLTDYDGRRLNIVHRDVSPQNVFITYSGHTKLVDFGIAKTLESSKTRAGVVKGKVPYMSPEQVLGGAIDHRADLFSVGVILWEAIARRHMHGTASVYEILRRLVQGELPRIREAVPEVPEQLERILERALSLKPEDRYADAAAFREDLVSFMEGRRQVTTREIGGSVSQLFAEERREINEVIRGAMTEVADAEFDSGQLNAVHLLPTLQLLAARASHAHNTGPTTAPMGPTTSRVAAPTTQPSTTPPFGNTLAPPVQMATEEHPHPATRTRKIVLSAAVAGVALAALLTFVFRAAPKPSEPAAAASSARSATVRVSIRAQPANALLALDGQPLSGNPYTGAHVRDENQHELSVTAGGFEPRTLPIRLDHDLDVDVGLAQTPAPAPEPKPSARPLSAAKKSQQQAPIVSNAPLKKASEEPYRDLPTRKTTRAAPPLDTSESPW
jgi:serine/threonine-protein kinase